eukprot:s1619_g20.t1
MLRERHQVGLGPYYVRAGAAPPCPGPPRAVVSQQGSGLAAPVIGVKPDTWSSWPKLSDVVVSHGGVTAVERGVVQGFGSSPVGPIIGVGSGRDAEQLELQKWSDAWISLLSPFIPQAPAFAELGFLAKSSLDRVLRQKAASTLRRHLPSWRLWSQFALHHEWPVYDPPLIDLVAFIQALVANGKCLGGAKASLCSLKFVASLMGWKAWLDTLAHPVILAWCEPSATGLPCKEALPLPLFVVAAFEAQVHEDLATSVTQDTLALVVFLLMVWGALRFSDIQRIDVSSIYLERGIVRGRCYRTKTSRVGMRFGLLTLGLYAAWDDGVRQLCNAMRLCDFLLAGPGGSRANFAYALGLFRKLLVSVGGVLPEQACNYTLHSLKTTGLSWALQLEVDHVQRRLWGHHRGRDSGTKMANKYSRDDVLPALRAQLHVLRHVRLGWVPLTPQGRGSSPPAPETAPAQPLPQLSWIPNGLQVPACQAVCNEDNGSETEDDSESSSSSSMSSDSESEEASVVEVSMRPLTAGVFMVNTSTCFYHAAICLGTDEFARACAPRQVLRPPRLSRGVLIGVRPSGAGSRGVLLGCVRVAQVEPWCALGLRPSGAG